MPFEYAVRNQDGTLGKMKKFGVEETAEEKAARLEQEAALLTYNDMMKELRITELEESQALLTYQLMQGGVI